MSQNVLNFGSLPALASNHFLSLPHPSHKVEAHKVVSSVQTDVRIKSAPFLSALSILGQFTFPNTLEKTSQDNMLCLAVSAIFQGKPKSTYPTLPPAACFPDLSAQVTAAPMQPPPILADSEHWIRSTPFNTSSSESHSSALPLPDLLHR